MQCSPPLSAREKFRQVCLGKMFQRFFIETRISDWYTLPRAGAWKECPSSSAFKGIVGSISIRQRLCVPALVSALASCAPVRWQYIT